MKEINCYITRNYYQLLKIAKTITKNDELHQDLLHECLFQILDRNEVNLKSYDDNSIRYFITAVMRINWFSKTSPFYYKLKKERRLYVDISECYDMAEDQEEFEISNIMDIMEIEYTELDFFQKSLMDLYLMMGSLKKVSEKTNIPITTISRYIRETKTNLKNEINKKLY